VRVESFRINLDETNLASQKNTLKSGLPQRCRAVGTYSSGNDTLVIEARALISIYSRLKIFTGVGLYVKPREWEWQSRVSRQQNDRT
jgi:hypothetical protein